VYAKFDEMEQSWYNSRVSIERLAQKGKDDVDDSISRLVSTFSIWKGCGMMDEYGFDIELSDWLSSKLDSKDVAQIVAYITEYDDVISELEQELVDNNETLDIETVSGIHIVDVFA